MKWFNKKVEHQEVEIIDVYITTHQRSSLLEQCLEALIKAVNASAFEFRIMVLSDQTDDETHKVLSIYKNRISVISTNEQLGLPFMFNQILDYSQNLIGRTEKPPLLICYLQDDAIIQYPNSFFDLIIRTHQAYKNKLPLGFITGFYSPIHPGFNIIRTEELTLIESDSLDGKNMIGPPELFESIGKLSWRDHKNRVRGNPGPIGSGFDLWQWRDSPTSTLKQKKVNLCIPGLIETIGSDDSTWNNKSDKPLEIERRIKIGKIYQTRDSVVNIDQTDFYKPKE
ncbi:MAG: glycosyltransferase [Cyclobacteriaceae bacterium]